MILVAPRGVGWSFQEDPWPAWLGALVLRQEFSQRDSQRLAHSPHSPMERGSCGNAVPCLKAGHQSSSLDGSRQDHEGSGGGAVGGGG